MFKRFISSFLSLLLVLLGVRTGAAKRCDAVFTGTFIQSWYCADWDDARWAQEIADMRSVGIDKLIVQDVAEMDADGNWTVWYPSALPDFGAVDGTVDVIGSALRACQAGGIRVFIGLAEFENWWVFGALSSEYGKVCRIMANMQQEIYDMYHADYPDAFYGWYFSPEINNVPTMKASVLKIARGLSTVLDAATAIDSRMPVLLSPYFTEYMAVPSVLATLPMWQILLQQSHLREGDIFCPQDAIGAQWTKAAHLRKVWEMYAAAVESCPVKLRLWANCECMTVARKAVPLFPPATLETENSPATLDRLVWQMQTAADYCEDIVTFSFNHYYSPQTGNTAYYDSWIAYLESGHALETLSPEVPGNLRFEDDKLIWDAAEDNIGVAYYLVLQNEKPFCRVESSQDCMCSISMGYSYAVIAVDGAGNCSIAARLS